jgi:ectoine hydroxylase-related dioxygenase (phytanoyl-CoA dioxygenase family)
MNLKEKETLQLGTDFHRDGFVIARGLFSPGEVAEIERQLQHYMDAFLSELAPGEIYYEDSESKPIKALHRMHERSAYFRDLVSDDRLRHIVSALLAAEPILLSVMFFAKHADHGSATPPHQDNVFQCWSPPDALAATIAIDASTVENGALTIQQGSHRIGLLPHRPSGVKGFSQVLCEPLDTVAYPEVALCMEPGDVAFHHVLAIHRSDPNTSGRSRRQLGIGYSSSHSRRDEAALARYKTDLGKLNASIDD